MTFVASVSKRHDIEVVCVCVVWTGGATPRIHRRMPDSKLYSTLEESSWCHRLITTTELTKIRKWNPLSTTLTVVL